MLVATFVVVALLGTGSSTVGNRASSTATSSQTPASTVTVAPSSAQKTENNDSATATLIAALIAAGAAILGLVAGRQGEGREVQRSLLEDHLGDLGQAIHEVVATASTQHKKLEERAQRLQKLLTAQEESVAAAELEDSAPSSETAKLARIARRALKEVEASVAASDVSANTWRRQGDRAAGELESLRRRLRYALEGADEGMRMLTRLPGWTGHCLGDARGATLLRAADALAQTLHKAIAYSWRSGRPPRQGHTKHIKSAAAALWEAAPVGNAPDASAVSRPDAGRADEPAST